MKTNQLAAFISFLTIFVLVAIPASAQNSDVSIDVSAEVISTIEMITLQSMNLTDAEEQNGIISINPRQSANTGKMVAIGTPNSDIRISYLPQRELTRQRGTETLLFEYEVSANTQDEQSTSEILDQENRDFEFNDQGRLYLWIGGNVDISTATPGNYQGEFTLDIEYI